MSGPGAEVILEVSEGGLLQVLQADFESNDRFAHVKAPGAGYTQVISECREVF